MPDVTSIQAFRGINRSVEPHLLQVGDGDAVELSDALNVIMASGAIVRRGGVQRISGLDHPLAANYWPSLLYSFNPFPIDGPDVPEEDPDEPGDDPAPPDDGDDDPGNGAIYDPVPIDGPDVPEPPPPPPPERILQTVLPDVVYYRVGFELGIMDPFGDYDGAQAGLTATVLNTNTGAVTDALLRTHPGNVVPNVRTGWADGIWTGTVKVCAPQGSGDALVARADAGSDEGQEAMALLLVPQYLVEIPEEIDVTLPFEMTITVRDIAGNTLTDYDGSGADLALAFDEMVSGEWRELDRDWETSPASQPILLTGGWTDGVWTGNVRVMDVTAGATAVRVRVLVNGVESSNDIALLDLGSIVEVILPETAEVGDPFTLELAAYDLLGRPKTNYDPTNLALLVEGWNGTAWVAFASLRLVEGGTDPDPTVGWNTYQWCAEVKLLSAEDCTQLRVTAVDDGIVNGDDVLTIGVRALLMAAIRERQLAYGIGDEWYSGQPTNVFKLIALPGQYVYTLDELKAYVNLIAPTYLADNDYAGGENPPAGLTAEYANSATDLAGLLALVRAMRHTIVIPAGMLYRYGVSLMWRGISSARDYFATWGQSEASIAARWSGPSETTNTGFDGRCIVGRVFQRDYQTGPQWDPDKRTDAVCQAGQWELSFAPGNVGCGCTSIRRKVAVVNVFAAPAPGTNPSYRYLCTYSNLGYSFIPSEPGYAIVYKDQEFANDALWAPGPVLSFSQPPADFPPVNPLPKYLTPLPYTNGEQAHHGFIGALDRWGLVEWEFTLR